MVKVVLCHALALQTRDRGTSRNKTAARPLKLATEMDRMNGRSRGHKGKMYRAPHTRQPGRGTMGGLCYDVLCYDVGLVMGALAGQPHVKCRWGFEVINAVMM